MVLRTDLREWAKRFGNPIDVPTAIEVYSSCFAAVEWCSYRAAHPSPFGGAVKANACHSPTYR